MTERGEGRTPKLGRATLAIELVRPWVLFAVFVVVAERIHPLVAAPIAAVVCFAAFVQMHDCIHESLGLSKRAHAWLLTASGQLLLKSGHALKATHLRHHGQCLGEADPEGAPAHWPLFRVLTRGPFHILAMRRDALRIAPRLAGRQFGETLGTVALLCAAIAIYVRWSSVTGLVYWAVAALVSAGMPLWAAYIPHRLAPVSPPVRAAARLAQVWTPILTSFAYHHVHHAQPKVPTALLPEVARTLPDLGAHVYAHVHTDSHAGGDAGSS